MATSGQMAPPAILSSKKSTRLCIVADLCWWGLSATRHGSVHTGALKRMPRGGGSAPIVTARERPALAATSAHLELPAAPVPGGEAAFASLAYGGMVTSPWDAAGAGVLRLPSGRLVRGRGLRRALPPGPGPTFAVYLLSKPPPAVAWEAHWVRWPDFWLPGDQAHARKVLHQAWERALTERVEIACPGGRGRTGTALACLAIIDGLPPEQAVAFVRQHYDPHAVETPWQKRYAAHFPIPRRSG